MKIRKRDRNKEKKAKTGKARRLGLTGLLAVLVVLVAVFGGLVGFITDYLWFKELGYVSVFFTQLFTQLKIGIPVFIVLMLLSYIYFKFLKVGYYKKIESKTPDHSKAVNRISWVFAVVFGLIVTYFTVNSIWFESLEFVNSSKFDLKDPLFNNDISFYVFKLDFINSLNDLVILIIILFIVMTVVYYMMLMGSRRPQIFEEAEPAGPGSDFGDTDEFDRAQSAYQNNGQGSPFSYDPYENGGSFGNLGKLFEKFTGGMNQGRTQSKPKREFDDDNVKTLFTVASKQLIVLGIILFLMVGVHFFLKQYELLYTHRGVVYGAGYTDVHITLWIYRIMMVLSVLGALSVIIGVKRHKLKTIAVIPVVMILISFAGTGVAAVVQNFVVSPDEINKESKYLDRNIEYTQHAYALNDVITKKFSADTNLTSADIKNNDATISNIRINDYTPTKKFYNQTQSIRQYYDFSEVDVDRYMVNGDYTQTFLSPREIDEGKISETWLNRHLKYTHGYGITMSRVDQITSSGQPDMLIKNIPPESSVKEISIDRPEIYFGEKTNEYIIVNTDEDEFDYPDGDSNKYTKYEGAAGIKLNPFNRLLFAIREHSFKLLVSSNVNNDSRIVIRRNVVERVNKIMPYLEYDKDFYMCTTGGKLYWIIDAYTTSDRYPYSEPYDSDQWTNYIRNSVKVVIDAYNGNVDYYIVDDTDPIAKTMKKIYPKLFKSMDEMPDGIKEHIRYPNKMFETQSKVYRRYHMNDVKVFYQNEDMWDISNEIYGTEEVAMDPHYYILNLPGEKEAEFVSTIPYTPKDKKNLTGILMARSDGDNYGELVLYKLPKSKVTYGPMQIEAQIDQSTEISKEFSLWNSAGSDYSRGNMFVIPIEDSLLYVEPVYLEATNSSIPEVKRVIVAYNDQIAYEPTLAEALDKLFGEGSGDNYSGADNTTSDDSGKKSETLTQSEVIQKAQKAYEDAQSAMKKGDWAEYGKHMEELEKYLNKLEK